jgi:signal transduction histidine kinase/HD-like signal output (HDOD) protein
MSHDQPVSEPALTVVERLDGLPSPSPLAMRLLSVAHDDASSARDLVEIIRQDAALTARILSLCRRGPRGRQLDIASLDRAVVLLGFGAVRSAALSVEFAGTIGGSPGSQPVGFDPMRFWRHALAKALVAEIAAKLGRGGLASRAFVAGLLHDLGALGLSRAAPALFDRACEESERRGASLDRVAKEVIGIGVIEAGARLAVRWHLPDELCETLRQRGVPMASVTGPHRAMVLLAELADIVVRRRHLGGPGFAPDMHEGGDALSPLLRELEVDPVRFFAAVEGLFEEVAARAESLGLSNATPAAIAADAIERASRRAAMVRRPDPSLDIVSELDAAGDPIATIGCIVRAIRALHGGGDRLLVVTPASNGIGTDGNRAEVREFDAEGRLLAGRVAGDGDIDGAIAARRWAELRRGASRSGSPAGALALACRGSTIAIIHRAEGEVLSAAAVERAPLSLWAFGLASSIDRQRAQRAAERSAEALRALGIARERLIRDRTLASLGEITAGLAHELNNPLTVVSGRAQLLRRGARDTAFVAGLDEIAAAAERASDLVGRLLRVARPAAAILRPTRASEIIDLALRFLPLDSRGSNAVLGPSAQSELATDRSLFPVERIRVLPSDSERAPSICLADPAQAADALAEVLQNALDAAPEGCVEVSVQETAREGRCQITVRDVGAGFSDRALRHALDPFFSERRSGRGAGLGLAKARSIIETMGGAISLGNATDGGGLVTIELPVADHHIRSEVRGDDRLRQDALKREAA